MLLILQLFIKGSAYDANINPITVCKTVYENNPSKYWMLNSNLFMLSGNIKFCLQVTVLTVVLINYFSLLFTRKQVCSFQ